MITRPLFEYIKSVTGEGVALLSTIIAVILCYSVIALLLCILFDKKTVKLAKYTKMA
jgi:hypothetical protein